MNRPLGMLVLACWLLTPSAARGQGIDVHVHDTYVTTAVAKVNLAAAGEAAVKPSPHVLKLDKVALATFSPDGKVLMTVGDDEKQVHFWSVGNGEEVNRFGVAVTNAIFSGD